MGTIMRNNTGLFETEHDIQNAIRIALSPYAVVFRINVGVWITADGRHVSAGVPKGFSDLFGHRRSDGRALYIEVKKQGGRIRPEQERFKRAMLASGAIAGIAYSVSDALKIIGARDGTA